MNRSILCVAAGVLLSGLSAKATPYASGITNNAGTVTWHLNESVTNGTVAILFNVSGSTYASSNYVGGSGANPVNAGSQTFSLGANTNFEIFVFNIGTGSPHQISPNPGTTAPSSPLVDFFGARGVGVNRNPKSKYFGTVYVANASATTGDGVRPTQRGVYAVNADFTDAFGYNTNAMPPVGTGAGQIQYGNSTTYGVWRVFVGPDDMVYIGDASGANPAGTTCGAGVTMATPDLSYAQGLFPFSGVAGTLDVFPLVCSAGTPNVTGSYAAGDLTLYNEEWNRSGADALGIVSGGFQSVWEYPFFTNSGTTNIPLPLPWDASNSLPYSLPSSGDCLSAYGYSGNGNPNVGVGSGIGSVDEVVCDFYLAPDGKFFCSEERSSTAQANLWIYDTISNGNCLIWDSLDANGGTDPFATVYGVSVSPDDQYIAMGDSSASGIAANDGKVLVCSLDSQPAATGVNISGLPDVSTLSRITYGSGADSLRGTAWDAADNVYAVSGTDDSMRCFTLGLTTTAITGNDASSTNGTFKLSFASVSVSVSADEALISQPNSYGTPTNGTFTLTRTGSTDSPLTVFFTLTGTATNGTTYSSTATNSVTFPAGSATVQVGITANSTTASANTLDVVLTLSGSASYSPTPPTDATMDIASTGPQEISITSVSAPSMYRGLSNDFASFIVTRYGDTNATAYTIPATSFTYGGTATVGVDYAAIGAVTFNPGDQSETVSVSNPVVTGVYHGNESITVTLNTNAGVPILAGSQTADLTLVDNMDPPATVLWSDTLNSAADSVNWTLTFANSNLFTNTVPPIVIPDYPNYTASNPDPNAPGSGTGLDDFDVEFGYDITNDAVGYSPTMLLHGWTNALKMTVNKITGYDSYDSATGGGASAGVNVYPAGQKFSGNYAFRFSMCLTEGTVYTTEYDTFGINHYGTNCNWFASDFGAGSGTTNSDGDWFWIDTDVDGQTGINTYIMAAGTPLPNSGWTLLENITGLQEPYTDDFKHQIPYNGTPSGVPNTGDGNPASAWADVEVKQVNGVITMSINKFPILVYNNTNYANSGDVMFGYDDPFASVGNVATALAPGAAVYYSNARVVQLTPPSVTGNAVVGNTLTISFTDSDTDDTAASFELLGSTTLNGTWAKVAATFSQTSSGSWQAVVTVPNGTAHEFYQVVRIN